MSDSDDKGKLKQRLAEAKGAEERTAILEDLPYGVGFGKPPKQSRFQPGQSGNRKGRPKGSLNYSTMIDLELEKKIEVTDHGKREKLTKFQVAIRQLLNTAAKGDAKAILTTLSFMQKAGRLEQSSVLPATAINQKDMETAVSLLEFYKSHSVGEDDGGGEAQ